MQYAGHKMMGGNKGNFCFFNFCSLSLSQDKSGLNQSKFREVRVTFASFFK